MLINKITIGYVIQVYDTEKKKFLSQEFIAGDDVSYEFQDGESILDQDIIDEIPYLPFEMIQP